MATQRPRLPRLHLTPHLHGELLKLITTTTAPVRDTCHPSHPYGQLHLNQKLLLLLPTHPAHGLDLRNGITKATVSLPRLTEPPHGTAKMLALPLRYPQNLPTLPSQLPILSTRVHPSTITITDPRLLLHGLATTMAETITTMKTLAAMRAGAAATVTTPGRAAATRTAQVICPPLQRARSPSTGLLDLPELDLAKTTACMPYTVVLLPQSVVIPRKSPVRNLQPALWRTALVAMSASTPQGPCMLSHLSYVYLN